MTRETGRTGGSRVGREAGRANLSLVAPRSLGARGSRQRINTTHIVRVANPKLIVVSIEAISRQPLRRRQLYEGRADAGSRKDLLTVIR